MAENGVIKKELRWFITNCSKGSFESYKDTRKIDSPIFKVEIGDEILEWKMRLNLLSLFNGLNLSLCAFCISQKSSLFEFNVSQRFAINEKHSSRTPYGYGWQSFVRLNDLLNPDHGFMVNDCLTMICDLRITELKFVIKKDFIRSAFCSDFRKMFDDETLSDIVIKTSDNKSYSAHKFVLAARSPVFAAQLTTMKLSESSNDEDAGEEASEDIISSDFDSTVMWQVLRFIYCLKVENLNEIAHSLILAAEEFKLKALKEICVKGIISTLTTDNVFNALKISEQVSDAKRLFEKCLDFIINNFPAVSATKEWKEFSKNKMLNWFIIELVQRSNGPNTYVITSQV